MLAPIMQGLIEHIEQRVFTERVILVLITQRGSSGSSIRECIMHG